MFQQLITKLAIQAVCAAMCQFFGFCCEDEQCPDGICDELFTELDGLGDESPAVTVSPARTQAFEFSPDWAEFQGLVECAIEFVQRLRRFLNLGAKVG